MKRLPVLQNVLQDNDKSGRKYWRSLAEERGDAEHERSLAAEFPDGTAEMTAEEGDVSRRNFLTLMGASLAMAGMTACRRPEEKILPYAKAPEDMIPGKPLYFATSTTFYGTAIGLIVESHEGRPTKIEGNPKHPESLGATTTFLQAMALEMYDPDRSASPLEKGVKRSWEDAAAALRKLGEDLAAKGGANLAVVTEAHRSLPLAAALADLKAKLPNVRFVRYEPFGRSTAHDAARLAFGRPLDAVWSLDKAMVIATIDSDCFYAESSPLKNARGWVANRDPGGDRKKPMNRMYAVESLFSVTGANADHRLRLTSKDVGQVVLAVAQKLGIAGIAPTAPLAANAQKFVDALAKDLQANRTKSAFVVGERQPPAIQAVGYLINHALGNVGTTVAFTKAFDDSPEGPKALVELSKAIVAKQVDTVLILGGNPAFNAPADAAFASALAGATTIHVSTHVDETSSLCSWHLNRAHFLEAWDALSSEDGTVSITQPLIAPLYDGKTDAEVVRLLLGDRRKAYELTQDAFAKAGGGDEAAWKHALHDGLAVATLPKGAGETADPRAAAVSAALATGLAPAGAFEIVFQPDAHAFDGRFANNAWLQEMPDPMTKVTWMNTAWISPATAKELGVADGEQLTVTVEGASVVLPVAVAPGQADKSIAVTLGQGRKKAGRVGNDVGKDLFPLFKSTAAGYVTTGTVARGPAGEVKKSASLDRNMLSRTQEHFNMEGRPLVREGTAVQYAADPQFVKDMVAGPPNESLWFEHQYAGHKWGMTIDLSACIGCNACMVACQAENNVPIVGELGVRKSREMHWLRIDRYFEGSIDDPRSVMMPMLCQQCENAPCEQVCPVAATTHSPEGLNDMAYNRCIGTRYCANNCPYKVRRFNFFNYTKAIPQTAQMQFNPDVTVRSRGVMEKCTWCVQRINQARIEAKQHNPDGRVKDGTIVTACQQACPTRAITFGDYNDPNSMVSRKAVEPRAYALLGEFNWKPRLQYLGKIRNPNPELEAPVAPPKHPSGGAGNEHPGGEKATDNKPHGGENPAHPAAQHPGGTEEKHP